MKPVADYLRQIVKDNADDLFIIAGGQISEKKEGSIRSIEEERIFPRDTERLISELYKIAGRKFNITADSFHDDFSFSVPGLARLRAHVFLQRSSLAAVVRAVAFGIPDWKACRIPDRVMKLADEKQGLILVTGPAGSGKSTTQACLIEEINRTRDAHIVTFENPIEHLYRDQRSIVSQMEVGTDVSETLTAARDCMAQAPDVVFFSELRNLESIRMALTIAEAGCLVIGTLYVSGAVNTVDYLLRSFPAEHRDLIRMQLSMQLLAVVSQQLVPKNGGGQVPVFELLLSNRKIQELLRDGELQKINQEIMSSGKSGMITTDQSLLALYQEKLLDADMALRYANDPEQLKKRMWLGM